MLIGYVSDERYVALADVLLDFEVDGQSVAEVRSTARGAVNVEITPGTYRVTLLKEGYGSKSVNLEVTPDMPPYHFRLLTDTIYGYMWPKWVKTGESSEFRVHSVEAYRLSLWRYGKEREFVKLLGWFDEHGPRAVMQITPDGDYTQTGMQWNKIGYGSAHHTQMVAGPQKSGLYYLHAKTESGKFFSFPWVVAPEKPSAKIAVLASTNTWNAYNNFGGRSNYINANRLPDLPTVNARQDLIRYTKVGVFNVWGFKDEEYAPLSFERPELGNFVREDEEVTDPIWGRLQCGMAPAEWRFLGWLEREGLDYDYYSEAQLHYGEINLDAYKVLIISVHPEYWSAEMYRQVKDWVYKRGGKLMYLGGNGLNCEVDFLDPATMRFKTYLAPARSGDLGMPDPNDPTRYLESRTHRSIGESEASLLGVVTTDSGIMTAAPYRAIKSDHWIFAGTGLKDGDLFGEASLQERINGGASGHETDKMSPSSPPNTVLLAKGTNRDEGGGEIVYYETESGGAVYSVGSITYNASILVDPHISRITANVITRFLGNKMSIYDTLGVRTVINCTGTFTRLGGTLMAPEVTAAMVEASKNFIVLEELQYAAGKFIAEMTGAEAAYVTSGAQAGLVLSIAACITGLDPVKMDRMPNADGWPNQVIMAQVHRNSYDHGVEAAGGRIVTVGTAERVTPEDYAAAINDKTVAILFLPWNRGGITLPEVVEVAHAHNIYVVVDAAGRLDEPSNLQNFIREGADLATFSGGKFIRGPQASGFVAGRKHLISAIAWQHLDMDVTPEVWQIPRELLDVEAMPFIPRQGIGRGYKAGKEEIIGLVTALRLFMQRDHAAERENFARRLKILVEQVDDTPFIEGEFIEAEQFHRGLPGARIRIDEAGLGMDAYAFMRALIDGSPSIHPLDRELAQGAIRFNPFGMVEGDAEKIATRVREIVNEHLAKTAKI